MAEDEKKSTFPWVQLIATIGTIVAALIGITPYILKLNSPSPSSQPPTIVFVTLPPAVTTPTPATTTVPVTTVETTPVPTQTTIVSTPATTGPPPTGAETPVPTAVPTTVSTTETTVATTQVETSVPTTTVITLPAGPAIQVSVNQTSVSRGGAILASVATDPGVSQVTITLRNSTSFESQPVTQTLVDGMVTLSLDTFPYAPGDYTISAAIPDTQSVASASFVIT
jgi:hypothetical protein